MKKRKIMLVFGTRPEAIKMAPLIKKLKKYSDNFEIFVTVTGQHREMLDQVLHLFEIKPDYDLDIMTPGQDLYDLCSKILLGMRHVLNDCNPDMVLVHGDTATSTAAALAAFYKQIPVGHVEAGLRTHNIYNPWPEEMNRQLTGRLASYHFTPTLSGKKNLLIENIREESIAVTGNTVIDALYMIVERIRNNETLQASLVKQLMEGGYDIARLNCEKRMVLITGHRRENFGHAFLSICKGIKHLCLKYPQVDFVYPMHLNPNVRTPIYQIFGEDMPMNMFFIDPLEYLPFIALMKKSYLVLTDSGGIQEEAPALAKPVLVMRSTTERPEAVEAGTVKLIGTNEDTIMRRVSDLLDSSDTYSRMSKSKNPYGDGHASERIVDYIMKHT